MKKTIFQKMLGVVLAGATVGSMAAASALSAAAAVDGINGIQGESLGITGSFCAWGNPDENGIYTPDVPMTDEDGDGIYEGIIDIPEVTEEMIQEASTEDEEGNCVLRGFSGICFKLRTNGNWDNNWGDYEPIYNRTWNSQTNCVVEAVAGQSLTIRVQLDTTTMVDQSGLDPDDRWEEGYEAYNVWPVTYEVVEGNLPLTNTSTIQVPDPMVPGSPVKVNLRAVGGAGKYSYAVYYKKTSASSWTCAQNYSSKVSTVDVVPKHAGTYSICVRAKDKDGTVEKKFFTVKVSKEMIVNALLEYDTCTTSADAALGGKVTVTCSTVNAKGTVQYQVYYKPSSSSKWTTAQTYSTNNVVTFTPKKAGDYDVCVRAKDETGKVVKKFLYFTVEQIPDLINCTSFAHNNPLLKGNQVVVNCESVNAVGECQYAVYYKPVSSTKWTTAQKYSTNTVVRITPKKVTEYEVSVKAKDARGQVKKTHYNFTVQEIALTNLSYAPSYSEINQPLYIDCDAAGGKGDYQYQVSYKQASKSSYTTIQKYSTGLRASFIPKTANIYDIRIKVKDAAGTVATKDMKVKVVKNQSDIPAITGTYFTEFSPEMEDYILSLPEDQQVYYNKIRNVSITLMKGGLLEEMTPNSDGTFENFYLTWHDNFDGTMTIYSIGDSFTAPYIVNDDGSVRLEDPDSPYMYFCKPAV